MTRRTTTTAGTIAHEGRLRFLGTDHWRPRTRADCKGAFRPCPYLGCRYHLALDTERGGCLVYPFGHLQLDELEHTCALDIAEQGSHTLEELGQLLGVTRERIRQIEQVAMNRLRCINGYTPALLEDSYRASPAYRAITEARH